MRMILIITLLITLPAAICPQTKVATDAWEPFKFFVGIWEGTGSGQPGVSRVQREYRLVLNDKYIQLQNKSTYDPQPKNPKGKFIRTGA